VGFLSSLNVLTLWVIEDQGLTPLWCEGGYVRAIGQGKGQGLCKNFASMYLATPDFLETLPQVGSVVPYWHMPVRYEELQGSWMDVGSLASYAQVEGVLEKAESDPQSVWHEVIRDLAYLRDLIA
jgi:hypothetical protein